MAASPHFAACPTAAHLFHLLEELTRALDDSVPYNVTFVNPFLNPLGWEQNGKACMVYDLVKELPGMMRDINREGGQPKARYLRFNLGLDSNGVRRIEGAHRLVLLATFGPPPTTALAAAPGEEEDLRVEDQCFHSCDNPACLNPLHLAWASAKENNTRVDMFETERTLLSLDKERVKVVRDKVMARKDLRMTEAKLMPVSGGIPWAGIAREIHTKFYSGV